MTDFPQPLGAETLIGNIPQGKRIRDVPRLWLKAGFLEMRQGVSIIRKVAFSHFFDLTWLSRELYAGWLTGEGLLRTPLVFDVDDAIWLNGPMGERVCKSAAHRASLIIAGNDYIGDWFSSFNENIKIIPTAVDTEKYTPAPKSGEGFTIGWVGTSSNFNSLNLVAESARRFLRDHKDARFLVVSDKPPLKKYAFGDRLVYKQWNESDEVRDIASFDVGVMPLVDSDWSKGKCSFKILQYMACGVPFVASPVGMNEQVIRESGCGIAAVSEGDWYEAFKTFYLDQRYRESVAISGRNEVCRKFSRSRVSGLLAEAFRGIA